MSDPGRYRRSQSTTPTDLLFLVVCVVASSLPYLGGLGLYSDDWTFLSALSAGADGFLSSVQALLPIEMATRPMQAIELAALYQLFGLEPLGYHVANTAILATTVVLFHLVLRKLGVPRLPALLVPLAFGVVPHYSTDRVWIAAFQANASVLLFFANLFADLRFVSGSKASRWLWKAAGSVALLGSVLAYEITAPLLAFSVVLVGYHSIRDRPGGWLGRSPTALLALASNLVLLVVAIAYKLSTTVRTDLSGGYLRRALRLLRDGVPVHFVDYGLGLPVRVSQVLAAQPGFGLLLTALVMGLAVGVYVHRVARASSDGEGFPWGALVPAGAFLFGLGYGVLLTTREIGFHPTGANNRTAVAAAIGTVFVLVGSLGWVSRRWRTAPARHQALAVLTGFFCAANTLVLGYVAEFWVRADEAQRRVIEVVVERFPELPAGSTILLDGLCPYVGPAPVFATGWDTTGMLQLTYGLRDVAGDVLKPNSEATEEGMRTLLFDDVINVYPYGERLWSLHVGTGEVVALSDLEAARSYLAGGGGATPSGCGPYTDGDGVEVF